MWTITSAADKNQGVTTYKDGDRYGGYGYPLPQATVSLNWAIVQKNTDGKTYSKYASFLRLIVDRVLSTIIIRLKVDGETYVWDSNWGDNAVNCWLIFHFTFLLTLK